MKKIILSLLLTIFAGVTAQTKITVFTRTPTKDLFFLYANQRLIASVSGRNEDTLFDFQPVYTSADVIPASYNLKIYHFNNTHERRAGKNISCYQLNHPDLAKIAEDPTEEILAIEITGFLHDGSLNIWIYFLKKKHSLNLKLLSTRQ